MTNMQLRTYRTFQDDIYFFLSKMHSWNRLDAALDGMKDLIEDGDPESVALELVLTGLAKAGRLKDGSELLLSAIKAGWSDVLPLEKTHLILISMAMKGAKEDDYAREFVEVTIPQTSISLRQ